MGLVPAKISIRQCVLGLPVTMCGISSFISLINCAFINAIEMGSSAHLEGVLF